MLGKTESNRSQSPDWDAVERDVVRKLRYLRAAWEHTAASEPEVHELMKRDLYVPAIKHLGTFCAAIQEKEEE
jgi:transposase